MFAHATTDGMGLNARFTAKMECSIQLMCKGVMGHQSHVHVYQDGVGLHVIVHHVICTAVCMGCARLQMYVFVIGMPFSALQTCTLCSA